MRSWLRESGQFQTISGRQQNSEAPKINSFNCTIYGGKGDPGRAQQGSLLQLQDLQQQLLRKHENYIQNLSHYHSPIMIQDRYRKSKNPFHKYFQDSMFATSQSSIFKSAKKGTHSLTMKSRNLQNTQLNTISGEIEQAGHTLDEWNRPSLILEEEANTVIRNEDLRTEVHGANLNSNPSMAKQKQS